ncbi:MAG: U32 family peptidase [Bacteroidales bacterium]|nr:U32 family peptidase [Bacteroidales bacterium]
MSQKLELLAPAKNYEQGREAINHGADALYIGAPSYGARMSAGNSLEDIESLVKYAHLFHSKVYVTVNTLLYDDEIEQAARLIHQLYNIGVDAVLIQDMGLLQCNLPPIELHASTQTHNATVERVHFLEQVGFRRVVLARETSLEQIRQIRQHTQVELESFVQGALCVCYSGQCYLSEYLTHRSGNRGCCTQPCRSAYDLYNEQGKLLRQGEHLLSLRDFSAAQHIEAMAEAGIVSFKIEGRLKDMGYVKNVTAYYRQLLDNFIGGGHSMYSHSSSGHCSFYFVPDLEKTFNRGFTDYFLEHRQPMASIATQKSIGKLVGTVSEVMRDSFVVDSEYTFVPGDGLCYFVKNELQGFLINRVDGKKLFPNNMPTIAKGTVLYRNNDFAFEKLLQGKTAVRKIDVKMKFAECPDGCSLLVEDVDGYSGMISSVCEKVLAHNVEHAKEQVKRQLTKMGDTCFQVISYEDLTEGRYFFTSAFLNGLRREVVQQLVCKRIASAQPLPVETIDNGMARVDARLDYRYNVVNHRADKFYRMHGAKEIESGIELSQQFAGKALMTTKYCLRFELGQCLRHKNNVTVDKEYQGNLYLKNNKKTFSLCFDCVNCQMQVFAKDRNTNHHKTKSL